MTCQSININATFNFMQGGAFVSDMTGLIGFNSTLGLGDSVSTLSVDLAGVHGSSSNVGKSIVFTCNSFTFAGILKNVEHMETNEGPKTKISCVCFKELLANYDVFMNKLACSFDFTRNGTYNSMTWNVRNVHFQLEGSTTANVGCGSKMGSAYGANFPANSRQCGNFGQANEWGKAGRGYTTYNKIFQALGSSVPVVTTLHNERLSMSMGKFRTLAGTVPYAATSAYKMTLLDLLNALCFEAGCDFYCDTQGGGIDFKIVNKTSAGSFGQVAAKVAAAKSSNKLISSSVGAEYKNEKTRRLIVGDKVNYVKELTLGGNMTGAMVLGYYDDGYPNLAYFADFSQMANTRTLQAAMTAAGYSFSPSHIMAERELLCTGSLAMWKAYGFVAPLSISRSCLSILGIPWERGARKLSQAYANGGDLHAATRGAADVLKSTTRKSIGELIYEEVCFPWIKNFYDTFYGKYYVAILSGKTTCYYDPTGYIDSTGIFLGEGGSGEVESVATDAGWPDKNSVIGCNDTTLFKDNSGRTRCFVGVNVGDKLSRAGLDWVFDPSALTQEYTVENNTLYTQAEIDGRMFNVNGDLGVMIRMPSVIPQRALMADCYNNLGLRASQQMWGGDHCGESRFGGTTNFSHTNYLKETYAAGRFNKIAIPFRSNTYVYGPYVGGVNGGGTDIQHREDINPWSYNGIGAMDTAGRALATDGLPTRMRYESGQVTIAESPGASLGGDQGAILASIVVKLDNSGSTTTYNYQTWTQKFGNFAENFNSYVKRNYNDRLQNFNMLRSTHLSMTRATSSAVRAMGVVRRKFYEQFDTARPISSSTGSQNSVLTLSYLDAPGFGSSLAGGGGQPAQPTNAGSTMKTCQELEEDGAPPLGNLGQSSGGSGPRGTVRAEAGLDKAYGADHFQDDAMFYNYAVMDLGMIFTPVCTASHSSMGNLPQYLPTTYYLKNGPVPRMPPFNLQDGIHGCRPITTIFLNPYTTAAMLNNWVDPKGGRGISVGFQCDYFAYGSDPMNSHATSMAEKNLRQNRTDLRGAALKGPLLLQSWGYDTNGKPIPNEVDSPGAAANGNFQYFGNSSNFMDDWLGHPVTWPVGPIDLRWDRERGCWVSPPSERLVIAQLVDDLQIGGQAKAFLIDPWENFYPMSYTSDWGGPLKGSTNSARILLWDVLARPIGKGSRVIAYHFGMDTGTANYVPLMVADTYRKYDKIGCCEMTDATEDKTHPCYLDPEPDCEDVGGQALWEGSDFSSLMMESLDPQGFKTLHDISSMWTSPGLWNQGISTGGDLGQMHVLGFQKMNAVGFPCMTGIPIIDCSGEFPGDGGGGGCPDGSVYSPTLGICIGV